MRNLRSRIEQLEQTSAGAKRIPIQCVVLTEGQELPPPNDNVDILLVILDAGQELPPQPQRRPE